VPWPEVGAASEIHDAVLDALHEQSRVVVSAKTPLPPTAGIEPVTELVTVMSHLVVVGVVTLSDDDPHAALRIARAQASRSRARMRTPDVQRR
jgi:hypothetical protein